MKKLLTGAALWAACAAGWIEAKDVFIEVKLQANGSVICVPAEQTAQRGDRLIWFGLEHSGVFDGKVKGEKQRGFADADLPALSVSKGTVDGAVFPTVVTDAAGRRTPRKNWKNGEGLAVRDDAPTGAYKYTIKVRGKKDLDPIVIIDP